MSWKSCLIATALLFLAVHGATAEEANAAPASLQAFFQGLQTPPVSPVTPEAAGTPEALPLAVNPPNGVACCRDYPLCCSTTPTEDACSDIGGTAFPTTQICALNCCW